MNLHYDNTWDIHMSAENNKENGYDLDIFLLTVLA